MSYDLLSKTEPIARKDYKCIWCSESISKGEKYVRQSGVYDGEIQSNPWHFECYEAAQKFFRQEGVEEFTPYECKRGSTEER